MPDTEPASEADVVALDKLFVSGVLVNLDTGYWSGEETLAPEDIDKKQSEIPEFVKLGKKVLVPADEISEIRSVAKRARSLLTLFSFKYPGLADLRFVPKAVYLDVKSKLDELAKEFWEAVDVFVERYPAIMEKQLDKFPDHRASLEPCYPSQGSLRKYFKFIVRPPLEFQIPKTLQASAFSKVKAEEEAKIMADLRTEVTKERNEFLKEVVSHLRAQTIEVFKSVKERLEDGKNATKTQIDKMNSFIERFEQLNFMGDSEVADSISKIKEELAGASKVTEDEFKKNLASSLENVIEVAEKADNIEEVTEGFKRNLLTVKEIKEDI